MKLWSSESLSLFSLHPSHQLSMRSAVITVALLTLGVAVAMALPPLPETRGIASYLPLHTLFETIAVVIAMLVFAVGWNAYRRGLPGNILLLACAFLGVGMLDFTHTISFLGMPAFVTPSSQEKAIDFWLSARSLAAIALLIVSVTPWRPLASAASRFILLAAVLILTGSLHWLFLFHAELTPRTFIPGQGLTPFKIYYEYALVALNLATASVLWMRMRKPLPFNAAALFGAVCTMALSEFLFTLYADVTDIYNLLGHIYKTVSYLFLYRAIFVGTIELPYKQLQAAQNQLQATLDAVPDLLFELDLEGRYHDYHSPRTDLLAMPAELFLGKTMHEVMSPEVAEIGMAALREANEIGHSMGKQIELTLPDGKHWFELSVSRKPVETGQLPCFIVLSHDITARKQAEAELRKLSLAVEQSPNSIVITDLDANIEYVNDTFVKLTGYNRDEVTGKNPRILQSGKTPETVYKDMWAHLARGEMWRGELSNKRKDGSEYIELTMISPVRQADGRISHYLAIKENITEAKKAEARIERLAHFDQLTGLPNRSLLGERFKYALSLAQRGGEPLAVMFLDLDHFKNINDTLGHTIGDQLLMEVATRIKATLREEDTVSRQGGDEFILILHDTDADGAAYVAAKLIEAVSQPCQVEQHELITTTSIGIAIYPHDGEDFETLSRNADAAMYRVKQGGRNDFRFYTAEMQAHSARTLQLANALRHALARNELSLHYQPQLSIQDGRTSDTLLAEPADCGRRCDAATPAPEGSAPPSRGRIVGAEALLRWTHPEMGMISPAEFIPIAEDSGQIIPIGEWVLRTAAQQLKGWLDNGLPPMVMAVNLSSVQFRQANITELITHILDEVKLPHEYLELELTEAVAMGDPLAAIGVMDKLYERGIRMSIDDFGTGYSSLSYLKKFKVYKLKIDQSFVRDITDDPDDKAIVSAIINMASSLGIQTIAEGVETAGQLAFLRLQGCDEVQGYYFSKPLPAEQFEAFVRKS